MGPDACGFSGAEHWSQGPQSPPEREWSGPIPLLPTDGLLSLAPFPPAWKDRGDGLLPTDSPWIFLTPVGTRCEEGAKTQ